jgi:aspartate/methionine/tyrosine aminotransferase
LQIAHDAGVGVRAFATLPEPVLPTETDPSRLEYLLICNPWKPLGRFLTGCECEELLKWLSAKSERFIIIDSVYDFSAPFHESTMMLAATGRVILLHSVTKGWLWPQTFGVAWAGCECPPLDGPFRGDSPSQDQLVLADQLLSESESLPANVAATLGIRKRMLLEALPREVSSPRFEDSAPGCYFFPVNVPFEELLKNHGVMGIPATAFGSKWGGTILTSLAPALADRHIDTAHE